MSDIDTSTARVVEYTRAVVMFDRGYGALLCNGCRKTIKTGFDHPDVASYCGEPCKAPAPASISMLDGYDPDFGLYACG